MKKIEVLKGDGIPDTTPRGIITSDSWNVKVECKNESLDFLEMNIISAIAKSSIFTFTEIEVLYRKLKSFDRTIILLKRSISEAKDPNDLLI